MSENKQLNLLFDGMESAVPNEATMKMWQEYVDSKLKAADLSENEKKKSMILVADTHWDENAMCNPVLTATAHVMKYASEALGGATVIHAGDILNGHAKKTDEEYPNNDIYHYQKVALSIVDYYIKKELYANFGTNFLYAWGNHDTNIIGYRYVRTPSYVNYYDPMLTAEEAMKRFLISDEDMYEHSIGFLGNTVVYDEEGIKELSSLMTDMGYGKEEIKEAEYMMRMHYYRDDERSKIRYIVTDTGACGRTQMGALKLSYSSYMATEYKWLIRSLKNVPEGYDIVFVGHQLTVTDALEDGVNVLQWNMFSEQFYDILSAFKKGEKISTSTADMEWALDKSELARAAIEASVITDYDFEKKFEGRIISLAGHSHVDSAWYINNGPKKEGVDTSGGSPYRRNIRDVIFGSTASADEGDILALSVGVATPYAINPIRERFDGVNMTRDGGIDSLRFDIVTLRDDGSVLITRIGAGQDRHFV